MTKQSFTRALLFGACTLAFTAPAFAQNAAEETATDNEIVVTAQNREQSVNDVPIAIDVVSGEELQNAGFASMNDVTKIAPVVQLNQDQGTVKITVRGVGTNSGDESQDTSVVVNIDGEYMNRPNAMSVALFDIDRVEVLRGPQGTLYGRNSTGGAINFITRKPGSEFGLNASASYGNYNAIRLDGGVDLPLGESAAFRIAGFYDEHDGYVKHPGFTGFGPFPNFAGGTSDDNKAYGGRIALRIEPGDRLKINLNAEYAKREFYPQAFAYTNLNPNTAPPGAGPVVQAGVGPVGPGCNAPGFTRVAPAYSQTLCIPSGTNTLVNVDRGNYAAPSFGLGLSIPQDTYALRGRFAYEFSDAATLTYIVGYRSFSIDPNFRTLPTTYRSFTFLDEADTQSHELRLNGEVSGITYQIGGFYFKETLDRESGFFLPIGGPNGSFLSYFGRKISSDSKSVFGQVEVPLGDTLTAVGGLRYTDNGRVATYRNAGPFFNRLADIYKRAPFNGVPPPGGAPDAGLLNAGPARKDFNTLTYLQTLPLDSKESKVTWLIGVNYKPNDDTLVYAKVSTGFKAGGFDSVGDYKPESNLAIEAGWKQAFGPSGQHQVNLGAFHYDYKDLQVSVLLDTTVGGQTFNAGKAKIWGIEAAADFKLTDNTTFSASVNYLNAKYGELLAQYAVFTVPGTGADLTGIGDLDPVAAGVQNPNFAGNRPPFSPEWVVTLGLDHVFDLGGSGTVKASASTLIKSSYFTDFFNYADGKQKSLTQSDFSLEYKPENERFFVQAFIRNIENKRALTYGGLVSAGPDDIFNWQFGTPRTYGIRVGVDF